MTPVKSEQLTKEIINEIDTVMILKWNNVKSIQKNLCTDAIGEYGSLNAATLPGREKTICYQHPQVFAQILEFTDDNHGFARKAYLIIR